MAASKPEVAKYRALVDTAKRQVEGAQRSLAEQQASYRICKIEQDDNIEKWGIEIVNINGRLSEMMDF